MKRKDILAMSEMIFSGNKKFTDSLKHITKMYLDQIKKIQREFENNDDTEFTELYKYLIKKCKTEEKLYEVYFSCLDAKKMVDTCGFYDSNKDFQKFLKIQSKEENIDLYNRYYAIYFCVYSQLEKFSLSNSLIKMAYIHLHNALDEYLLELIHTILLIKLKLEQSINDETYESMWRQQCRNNSKHRYKYLRDNILGYTENCIDDIILFSEIRNALIHNNGIIGEKFIRELRETKYKDDFIEGEKLKLSIEDFKSWIDKCSTIRTDLACAFASSYSEYIIEE